MFLKKINKELLSTSSNLQVVKFIFVGIMNNFVYYSVFLFFVYQLGFHFTYSMIISYGTSIVFGYVLNTLFTFSFPYLSFATSIKYIVVYSCSLLVNYMALFFLIEINNVEIWIAQLFGTILVASFNFFGLKFIVYKKQGDII